MKKCYLLLTAFVCSYGVNAQVGINTSTPQATLDVQKSTDTTKPIGIIPPRVTGDELKALAPLYGPAQNGALVYVTQPVSIVNEPKTSGVNTRGLFVYDAVENNGVGSGSWQILPDGPSTPTGGGAGDGAYASKFDGNVGLLNLGLGLFDNNFLSLPLSTTTSILTNEILSPQVTNNEYVVPSTGLYQINYSYRTGSGLSASLLSGGTPGVAILKIAPDGTQTLLDRRNFGGVNLLDINIGILPVVVSITLTQGTINHIYQLQTGDRIRFGIIQGGVTLGLLAQRSAEISVYKIK